MVDFMVKTIVRRVFGVVSVPLFCLINAYAQTGDTNLVRGGVLGRMYCGMAESVSWYDIPIASVDLAELLFVPTNVAGKPIHFPPSNFDNEFQSHVGVRGSQTFVGQISEVGAMAFLGTRLLVNIGADLAGKNVTSEDYHRTFWFYKSIVYTYSVTMLAKNLVDRKRPDGSDNQSFFSGHSSTAFCTASYLSLELNDWYDRWEETKKNPVLRTSLKIGSGVLLYSGAAYVAYSRMHDEKHYFTDVAVGAAIGTIVGTVIYRSHWSAESTGKSDVSFIMRGNAPGVSYTIRF